ncbi:MAG: alpha-glucuronidase [Dysgonamonadaceae bacterium]|jgi:alpha-glucuronidase|nr:alpha-glucuronidase [Dysgonamonadaceae bacterium]
METLFKDRKLLLSTFLILFFAAGAFAEDGSRLWLPSEKNYDAEVTANVQNPTVDIAVRELRSQWNGAPVRLILERARRRRKADDGFGIIGNRTRGVTIEANTPQGLLYGAYHLLRLQQTGEDDGHIYISESPAYDYRILNHWDNLDGSIERGYAGKSLWQWDELPDVVSPRYEEYARANASIGINGAALNNVNANPIFITTEYLKKAAAIADVFRPYGIKTFLSVNFSSPVLIGGLETSDPLNADVQKWWKDKADEIYRLIPDFGGFLVKANSEGQPGPQDFGRTHADGANMLAEALKPHGGIVMWRAFVYAASGDDRAKQAYDEFTPLDGQFLDNVIIQVKNGPIDFQPREPFSPLFGAMKYTPLMIEFQITREYLGQSRQFAYLAPLYSECLQADTYCEGEGSTVAKVTAGHIYRQPFTAIAGVANTGSDANWTGHPLGQADWYCFGRLAWNPDLTPEQIADEWLKQTFTTDSAFVEPVKRMMLASREAMVNYMMPLGLHHLFAWNEHYGPEPWCYVPGARADWLPSYYHKADTVGIGFNRSETGSRAVFQYYSPLRETFNDIETCPEEYLLWFHHAPWDYRMHSGRTLWSELCYRYQAGVYACREFQKVWDKIEPYIDHERFSDVQSRLRQQTADATWWKDACVLYFQKFSRRPIPYELERPIHNIE